MTPTCAHAYVHVIYHAYRLEGEDVIILLGSTLDLRSHGVYHTLIDFRELSRLEIVVLENDGNVHNACYNFCSLLIAICMSAISK